MEILGKKTKLSVNSKIAESYFEQANSNKLGFIEYDEDKFYDTFTHGDKCYAVVGFEHYNGHMTNFRYKGSIYAVFVKKVK